MILKKSAKKVFLFILGIATIIYVTSLIQSDIDEIKKVTSELSIISIIFAIFVYFLSHLFRVMRLLMLSPNPTISIRELCIEQIKANGINLMVPFRMGESYRVIVFKKFFNSYTNSFVILICERLLDILLIASILFIATIFSDIKLEILNPVIMITSVLLLIILLLYFSLEEFLAVIHKIFLSKQTTRTTLAIVANTSRFIKILKKTKEIFTSKLPSCILITIVIWFLEIIVFYILFGFLGLDILIMVFLAICIALSSLLPNGPAGYGGVQLAFYVIGISIGFDSLINYSFAYNIYIFGTAISVSGILFFITLFFTKKESD